MVNVRRVRARDLLTPTKLGGDYAINPYTGCPHKCVYCYAACINWNGKVREEAWGDFLDVKIPTAPINLAKAFRKQILLSSMTDAYNPYEERAELTRSILKELIPAEPRIVVITKSKLVVRDIDLLKRFPYVRVVLSFSSLDNGFRRAAEPHASSPQEKIDALKALRAAGLRTSVFIAPTFPGISNPVEIARAVSPWAQKVNADSLNVRPQNKEKIFSLVRAVRPDLMPLYNEIYNLRDRRYWTELRGEIKAFYAAHKISGSIFF
jgi:DNA repair photolyase